MDFNKLAQEINQINQEKGWNDLDRRPLEIIALIHSEISEAADAYEDCGHTNHWHYYIDKNNNNKPEGLDVEIADAFIRTLGYLAFKKYDLSIYFYGAESLCLPLNKKPKDIYKLLLDLHRFLSMATELYRQNKDYLSCLARFAETIYTRYVAKYDTDYFLDIVREKIEYNKTRPYRHGNKEA